MAVTVLDLIAGRVKPACVAEDAMAVDALRLMMAHDYSQLPVVNDNEELVGMITSDSVARALNLLALKVEHLKVSNAIQQTKQFKLDSDLSDLLDGLRDTYAVPVVDNFKRVIGIVTNYDTADFFRSRAEDMMDVEDVENAMKDCLRIDLWGEQGKLDDSELAVTISKEIGTKTFDMLTFNDYLLLFIHGDRWNKFSSEVDLDRNACRLMLEQVKDIRNDLFHFRTEISAERRYALKYCRDWLNRFQSVIMQALRPAQVQEPKPVTIDSLADEKGITPDEVTSQVEALADNPQLIEKVSPDTSKYEGIATFLQTLPSHIENVQLSFDEFESIIEAKLPRSAFEHRSWWANDSIGHIQSKQWLEVGWRVSSVNISERRATFSRIKGREQRYIEFFSHLLEGVRANGVDLGNVSPTGRNYIALNGIRSDANERIAFVGASFARGNRFRVEFYIDAGDHVRNHAVFAGLKEHIVEVENSIKWKLSWENLDERRAFRIAAYINGSITDTPEQLETVNAWAVEMVTQFDEFFVREFGDKIVSFDSTIPPSGKD